MKSVIFTMTLLCQFVFAGEFIVETKKGDVSFNSYQLNAIANQIDDNSLNNNLTAKSKTLLQISSAFRELSADLDDPEQKGKVKTRVTLTKMLLGLSKGLTATSIHSARPFVATAGFFTGVFQKTSKNMDAYDFLQFYLGHTKRFDKLYLSVDSLEEYTEKTMDIVKDIMIEKFQIIIEDSVNTLLEKSEDDANRLKISKNSVLKSLGLEKEMTNKEALSVSAIVGDYFMDFNISLYSPALINEHPEYQDIRAIIGDFSADDLNLLIMDGDAGQVEETINNLDFGSILNGARLTIVEGLAAFGAQLFLPKIILGTISKSVSNIIFVPTLIADVGMISAVLVCTKNKNIRASIESGDEALKEFCNFTLINSAYVLSRSRARGFVAGKKFRMKLISTTRKIGQRIKDKKEARRKRKNPVKDIM